MKNRKFIALILTALMCIGMLASCAEEPKVSDTPSEGYTNAAADENSANTAVTTLETHTHAWEEGVCTVCGERCAHIWENGHCTVCGLSLWVDGICRDCGEEHSHTFDENSVCTVCEYVCPHVSHDRYYLYCDKCGYVVDHEFDENGICVRCGVATDIYNYGSVDELYVKDSDQPGTVVQLSYDTVALAGKDTGNVITKKVNVYLPYGYSESEKYNVYYYLHGAFGTVNDIIRPNEVTDTQKFLDNIIAEGVCEPFIFVTPTWFDSDVASGDIEGTLQENFNIQLRNSIIPAVESTFSTYLDCDFDINNVTQEKIAASRDHRAIGGFSGGATVTGMMTAYGLDMFSYFAMNSNTWDPDLFIEGLNREENRPYDIKFLMSTHGTAEGSAENEVCIENYKVLAAARNPKLIDGQNMAFVRFIGLAHDIVNIRTSIFNAMKNHFFLVASDDTDYSSAAGFSGELTATVTDQYGEEIYTFTLEPDGTINMHCSAYTDFIQYDDEGTYVVNGDGTISATFTLFTTSMGSGGTEHEDTCLIEKTGTQWLLHYSIMDGAKSCEASGELTASF